MDRFTETCNILGKRVPDLESREAQKHNTHKGSAINKSILQFALFSLWKTPRKAKTHKSTFFHLKQRCSRS
jgi:hypothetical protein